MESTPSSSSSFEGVTHTSAPAPLRTMKRTSHPSWASMPKLMHSVAVPPPTSNSDDASASTTKPKEFPLDNEPPAKVVSDIVAPSQTPEQRPSQQGSWGFSQAVTQAQKLGLASSSRIAALQKKWELNQQQQALDQSKMPRRNSDLATSLALSPGEELHEGPGHARRISGALGDARTQHVDDSSRRMAETPVPIPIPTIQKLARELLSNSTSLRQDSNIDSLSSEQATDGAIADTQRSLTESIMKHTIKPSSASSLLAPSATSIPVFLTSSQLLELKRQEFLSGNDNLDSDHTDAEPKEPVFLGTTPKTNYYPCLYDDRHGRSYYTYKDSNGMTQHTFGAPLPPGYLRAVSVANQPYICPVRDCRVMMPLIKSLASHFHGRHSGILFNDNGDGTFSKRGLYKRRGESSPGIIVSQDPLPQDALPPATPRLHGKRPEIGSQIATPTQAAEASKRPPDSDARFIGDLSSKRPRFSTGSAVSISMTPVKPPMTTQGGTMPSSQTLRYLHSHLSQKQEVPDREEIRALAKYPKLRDLPAAWLEHYEGRVLEPIQYSCALAYIVGEELVGAKACRRRSSRLSAACIVLPSGLSSQEQYAFSKLPTCLSCRYHAITFKQSNDCLWGQMQRQRSTKSPRQKDTGTVSGHESASDIGYESEMEVEEEAEEEVEVDAEDEDEDEEEYDDDDQEEEEEAEFGRHSASTIATVQSSTRQDQRSARALHRKRHLSTRPRSGFSRGGVPSFSQMPQNYSDEIEMEDWEVAPGIIKDGTTNEIMGYSITYLSSSRPIQLAPDIGLNVITIEPGITYHWPVEHNQFRSCTLISGKLYVQIDDGEPFKVGMGGFVIRPNQKCSVWNRLYMNTKVFCTTIHNYELMADGAK